MTVEIEQGLHWTEHYVRYGFAVRKGLIDREFCREALTHARQLIGNELPLEQWNTENTQVLHRPFYEGATPPEPVFDELIEQPRLRAAIEELYSGPGQWNEERNYYLFLRPYNEQAQAKLAPIGHIDFPAQRIPVLYRGFTFQVALNDTEPFSGNITVYPGTHKTVQKMIMDDPQIEFKSGSCDLPVPEPFEFVAEAGDVIFVHHLIFHSGNESHAAHRSPRIALHGEAFRDAWLPSIDPEQPNLSPWERSLAHNGPYTAKPEVEQFQMQHRGEYLDKLRAQGAAAVSAY